jgi:hypothetical protein
VAARRDWVAGGNQVRTRGGPRREEQELAQLYQSVDIARPVEEVFASSNSANDTLWASNLVEVTETSPEVWAAGPTSSGGQPR